MNNKAYWWEDDLPNSARVAINDMLTEIDNFYSESGTIGPIRTLSDQIQYLTMGIQDARFDTGVTIREIQELNRLIMFVALLGERNSFVNQLVPISNIIQPDHGHS